MRNFITCRFVCISLVILVAALSGRRLSGAEVVTEGGQQDIRLGRFLKLPFHVSISVRGGYDDNVLTSTLNRQGSAFVIASLGVNYQMGTSRTTLSLASNFGITDYINGPSGVDYDINPKLNLSLTHKATPRLTLALTSYITYQQNPDFEHLAGLNRRSGNFFYTSDRFSAAYHWTPRFSTVTSYTFVGLAYENSSVGAFEDRTEHTFGNEFRFLVLPMTSLIGEYRFGIIAYTNSGLLSRDSTSHFLLAGFDHSLSPRFNITARGGAEIRTSDVLGTRMDPYAEGNLSYAVGPHMSLSWTNRYSIEQPNVPGSPARTTFRTGLSANYSINPRLSSSLSVLWEHDNNEGRQTFFFVSPAFTEDVFSLAVSLRYALHRHWGLEVGYDFADIESDLPFREYYRNRFSGGVNFQF